MLAHMLIMLKVLAEPPASWKNMARGCVGDVCEMSENHWIFPPDLMKRKTGTGPASTTQRRRQIENDGEPAVQSSKNGLRKDTCEKY